jgi:hypothetical protein
MTPDITRRLALFLCDRLTSAIRPSGSDPEVKFVPEHGVDGQTTAQVGDGPFAVPLIIEANQVNPPAEVYMVTVHLSFQTLPDDTAPDFHADVVRRMMAELQEMRRGGPGLGSQRGLYIHGLYIAGTRPVPSPVGHVTMIDLRVGCAPVAAP